MSSKTSFEVQVLQDKHWVIAEMHGDEAKAKAFADSLLQTGNHEAVRVVKDFQRIDGTHSETVIVEKKSDGKSTQPVGLCPITEAPPCAELDDFYKMPARQTMGRLLRKYCDEVFVTPTELLHSAAELKRFGDKDRLLFSAIDRVASLQAQAAGVEAKVRREALDKAWNDINARAKEVAAKKLPTVKTFAELKKAVGSVAGNTYLAYAVMTQALLEKRSWIGKLDLLLAWSAEAGAEDAMPMIDGVVSDILLSAQLIQDLLGFQSNLAHALCSLCDLAEGKAEAAKFSAPAFATLNTLFAEGKLPQSKAVLLTRVVREVAGVNPLSRNDAGKEFEMFNKVVRRLLGYQGLLAGPAAAEALLQRGARVYNSGGATLTALQALDFMVSALNENCLKVQYLSSLAESALGTSMGELLTDVLTSLVKGANDINAWVPARVPPRDRMAALYAANKVLVNSKALPGEVRGPLGGHIDEVLAKYLLDEEVIEKIDKQDDPLAMRAIRLIKFCGSGVLIEGKSLDLARHRVIEHLKQKQFEEKFLASVPDPVQAEKHLREFHRLLVETGFR